MTRRKLAVAAVILLCALSTGGQQEQQQNPSAVNSKQGASRKPWGKYAVPERWRMPDGRVVEFPTGTSKEEIDELAKRIAEGAVELPPGARVIGWEPVEDATSLLPEYEQRLATIPTTKDKLDALANAAGILQRQIIVLQIKLDAEHTANDAEFRSTDKTLNNHADNLDALAAQVAYLAQQEQMRTLQPSADALKRELDDFKEAACPVLRTARMGEITRMNLDSACGLH